MNVNKVLGVKSKMMKFIGRAGQPVHLMDSGERIISIHIPKTAGTSFRLLLQSMLGETNVLRVDYPLLKQRLRVNGERSQERALDAPVIHGHFNFKALSKEVELPSGAKLITWLRDPVERVISNYYYLKERLEDELKEEGKGLNILSKMMRSMEEYAAQDINRNIQSRFLEGLDLDDFFFIGLTECFKEDCEQLCQMLKWPHPPIPEVNKTASKRRVSESVRSFIRSNNERDVELYERVKRSREL